MEAMGSARNAGGTVDDTRNERARLKLALDVIDAARGEIAAGRDCGCWRTIPEGFHRSTCAKLELMRAMALFDAHTEAIEKAREIISR